MSTDTIEVDAGSPVYRLHPSVSLRPERFGALAYSFDTRKLSFLKHPDLVAVVESFDGNRTLDEAMDHVGVELARRRAFEQAVRTLEASAMVVRDGGSGAA